MSSTITNSNQPSQKNSIPTTISYGFGKFLAEFFGQAFGITVFYYFEAVIGLDTILATVGFILYSIWNAINDPLIGFISNRPTRFTAKLGRRFPWIFVGTFAMAISFIFIFAIPLLDPEEDKWLIFFWMVLSTCLYDTIYSAWEVNYQSIAPDKFRDAKERTKAAGIWTIIGIFGIVLGSLLPTMITDDSNPKSYLTFAFVFCGIGIVIAGLMLHGVRETPEMIERFIKESKEVTEKSSFIQDFKQVIKSRNYMSFILLFFLYQSATVSITASVYYLIGYVLEPGSSSTILLAGFLIGALLTTPLWMWLAKKNDNTQKFLKIGAIWMAIASTLMFFDFGIDYYWQLFVLFIIWGAGLGLFWFIMTPHMSDIIDEVVVTTGERKDGIYFGFRAFFGRLAIAMQALSFGIVHILTGFDNDPERTLPQEPEAVLGIKLHFAIIPAVFLLLGVLIFQLTNKLTPERAREIRAKLKTLEK